jgi:hypothetical protein
MVGPQSLRPVLSIPEPSASGPNSAEEIASPARVVGWRLRTRANFVRADAFQRRRGECWIC